MALTWTRLGIVCAITMTACERVRQNAPHDSVAVQAARQSPSETHNTRICSAGADLTPATKSVSYPFAGVYNLQVVASGKARSEAVVTGELRLHQAEGREPMHTKLLFLGSSSVELSRLGPVSLMYSPTSTTRDAPGVELVADFVANSYTMVFGNATSGAQTALDAGVYFEIEQVGPNGFEGTWQDGGRRTTAPRGYFCARR